MSNLQITSPTNNVKFEQETPVTFQGTATTGIVTVKLKADDKWDLGGDTVDANGLWSITYSGFHQAGDRKITAIGFNETNQKQAETGLNMIVVGVSLWIPWAKTPQNDTKLAQLSHQYGHPNMKGKYRYGWPEGIIYHHTAGRTDPYGTIGHLWTRFPCLVVGRDGTLYQPFPLDEWGCHSGTAHHEYCVGVEVVGAGLLKPVEINGVTKYAPWFAFDKQTDHLKYPELCLDKSECRYQQGDSIHSKGWYQKFTSEQEKTVEKLCLYLKKQRPDIFSFDKIKGHDEAVAESGHPYRKNDPGGSLSITMDKFRDNLKKQWANA